MLWGAQLQCRSTGGVEASSQLLGDSRVIMQSAPSSSGGGAAPRPLALLFLNSSTMAPVRGRTLLALNVLRGADCQ